MQSQFITPKEFNSERLVVGAKTENSNGDISYPSWDLKYHYTSDSSDIPLPLIVCKKNQTSRYGFNFVDSDKDNSKLSSVYLTVIQDEEEAQFTKELLTAMKDKMDEPPSYIEDFNIGLKQAKKEGNNPIKYYNMKYDEKAKSLKYTRLYDKKGKSVKDIEPIANTELLWSGFVSYPYISGKFNVRENILELHLKEPVVRDDSSRFDLSQI